MKSSLWSNTLASDDAALRPSLDHDLEVDVVIVGAGFTGLWTAHYLLQATPGIRIAIVEAETAGFGASGRNGGWCSAMLPMDPVDPQFARAMRDTVTEVGRQITNLGIDCGWEQAGWLQLARNPFQVARARHTVGELRAAGDLDAVYLESDDARARLDATRVLGASFTPWCAALHPGRLVRGLAASVERRGASIYENTAAADIRPGLVVTAGASVRADFVVRATEGFTARLPKHRRSIVPLYSLMIATDVLSEATWEQIGLQQRSTFSDARHQIVYGQRTADGRLAFGGRGAPYHFASRISPKFDVHQRTHELLRETLVDLLPILSDVPITHAWGGPLGVARDWECSVGLDRATGLAWAGGYVGDGVATTNLAGRTLADLITGEDSDLVGLSWVGHRSALWEPEPFRWLGVNLAARLPERADRREASGRSGGWSERLLNRLVG